MNKVGFIGVMKKCVVYYGYFGVFVGVVMFFITIFNTSVPFHVGEHRLYGLSAGLVSLFFIPVVMAMVGLFHSFMLWFPGILIVRYFKNRFKNSGGKRH